MKKENIENIAAEWWAAKIKNPALGNYNNGENDNANKRAALFAAAIAAQSTPEEKNLKKFKSLLEEKIAKDLKKNKEVILRTDYSPVGLLEEVSNITGIKENSFPWKTVMWIEVNKITVRDGYNASPKVLYEAT